MLKDESHFVELHKLNVAEAYKGGLANVVLQHDDGSWSLIDLKGALLVSGLDTNLISLGRFTASWYSVVNDNNSMSLYRAKASDSTWPYELPSDADSQNTTEDAPAKKLVATIKAKNQFFPIKIRSRHDTATHSGTKEIHRAVAPNSTDCKVTKPYLRSFSADSAKPEIAHPAVSRTSHEGIKTSRINYLRLVHCGHHDFDPDSKKERTDCMHCRISNYEPKSLSHRIPQRPMHMMRLDEFGKISPTAYNGGQYALVIRDLYTKCNHVIILNTMTEFLPALK
jgi:hypothetical protein